MKTRKNKNVTMKLAAIGSFITALSAGFKIMNMISRHTKYSKLSSILPKKDDIKETKNDVKSVEESLFTAMYRKGKINVTVNNVLDDKIIIYKEYELYKINDDGIKEECSLDIREEEPCILKAGERFTDSLKTLQKVENGNYSIAIPVMINDDFTEIKKDIEVINM